MRNLLLFTGITPIILCFEIFYNILPRSIPVTGYLILYVILLFYFLYRARKQFTLYKTILLSTFIIVTIPVTLVWLGLTSHTLLGYCEYKPIYVYNFVGPNCTSIPVYTNTRPFGGSQRVSEFEASCFSNEPIIRDQDDQEYVDNKCVFIK